MSNKQFKRNNFKKKKLPFASKKVDSEQNKKLKEIEKKVDKLSNEIELKYHDTKFDILDFEADNAGILLLNGIAQGQTERTHIGTVLNMTSLQLRLSVRRNPLELSNQTIRLIIIYDKAPKGVAITMGEVLDQTQITGATFLPWCPYNLDYVGTRIRILYDKTMSLNPNTPDGWVDNAGTITVSGYAPMEKEIIKHIKLNKKTDYGLGVGGAIASIATGSLYALLVSSEAASASNYTATGASRVYFRDA